MTTSGSCWALTTRIRRLRLDGREGGAAAVEHDEVGTELDGQLRSLVDVRDRDRAGEPAAAAAAADRLDAGERGRLEVVRRGVAPGARELEQRVEVRRDARDLGLGRPAAPHRDDDDLPVARIEPRGVSGDRRLADPLAGADDPDRRQRERRQLGRVEAEVGADVRQPGREHAAREAEALPRAEHGLVGEIDDELRPVLRERGLEIAGNLDAVVGVVAQLLGAADDVGGDEVVRELLERRSARPARSAPRRSGQGHAASRAASSPRPRSGRCTSRTRTCRARTG